MLDRHPLVVPGVTYQADIRRDAKVTAASWDSGPLDVRALPTQAQPWQPQPDVMC